MNLLPAISHIVSRLDQAGVRYVLIGGWAVSMRGVLKIEDIIGLKIQASVNRSRSCLG